MHTIPLFDGSRLESTDSPNEDSTVHLHFEVVVVVESYISAG